MSRKNFSVNINLTLEKEKIGHRIREYADNNYGGLTNLAKKLNMSLPGLSQYARGEYIPGTKLLSKFAQLGCDLYWLLFGVDYSKDGMSINELDIKYNSEIEKELHKSKLKELEEEIEKLELENHELRWKINKINETLGNS